MSEKYTPRAEYIPSTDHIEISDPNMVDYPERMARRAESLKTDFNPGPIDGNPVRLIIRYGRSWTSVIAYLAENASHLIPDPESPTGVFATSEGREAPPQVGQDILFGPDKSTYPGFRPILWILTGPPDGPKRASRAQVAMCIRLKLKNTPGLGLYPQAPIPPFRTPWVLTSSRLSFQIIRELEDRVSINRHVSQAMRAFRSVLGLTQARAAHLTGTSKSSWAHGETQADARIGPFDRLRRVPPEALFRAAELVEEAIETQGLAVIQPLNHKLRECAEDAESRARKDDEVAADAVHAGRPTWGKGRGGVRRTDDPDFDLMWR